jgi:hypothetical protein
VVCCLGPAILARVEHDARLAWLALPALLLAHRATLRGVAAWSWFVAAVALADASLVLAGTDPLGIRARRTAAYASWRLAPDPRRVAGTCPRVRFRAGDAEDPGGPRDARGRLDLGDPSAPTWLVLGDSVTHGGHATGGGPSLGLLLHTASVEGGRELRVLDASTPDWDTRDYACALDEALADGLRPDLVAVGLSANDVPLPTTVDADVGAGSRRYLALYVLPADPADLALPPLVYPSGDTWGAAHLDAYRARFGDALVPDVTADRLAVAAPVEGVVARLEPLLARARGEGLRTAILVLPVMYPPGRMPTEPTSDALVAALAERGARVVDLRGDLGRLGHDALEVAERPWGGHVRHDLLHLPTPALAVVADAVVATELDRVPAAALEATRRALLRHAEIDTGCARWTCTPRPLVGGPPWRLDPAACTRTVTAACGATPDAAERGVAAPSAVR